MTVLETPRLLLRQFTWDDLDFLAALYADPTVMNFLGGPRSHERAQQHLGQILTSYEEHGFGLWATIHKSDRQRMGRCGLIYHPNLDGKPAVEIAYLLAKEYWGQGLATEVARAIRDYGFNTVGCDRLISLIDPLNLASQRVAQKVGLSCEQEISLQGKLFRMYAIPKNTDAQSEMGDRRPRS